MTRNKIIRTTIQIKLHPILKLEVLCTSKDAQLDHFVVGCEYGFLESPHAWRENRQTRQTPHHQARQEGPARHMADHQSPAQRTHSR